MVAKILLKIATIWILYCILGFLAMSVFFLVFPSLDGHGIVGMLFGIAAVIRPITLTATAFYE